MIRDIKTHYVCVYQHDPHGSRSDGRAGPSLYNNNNNKTKKNKKNSKKFQRSLQRNFMICLHVFLPILFNIRLTI